MRLVDAYAQFLMLALRADACGENRLAGGLRGAANAIRNKRNTRMWLDNLESILKGETAARW